MTLHWMNDNTADRLIGTLCNTLMHSLWQGVLLAAVAGLVVIWTRKASSALRYNLLIGSLALFAVGVSVTFAWQYQKSTGVVAAQHIVPYQPNHLDNLNNSVAVVTNQAAQPTPAPSVSFTDRVSGFLNVHHNTIVLIWFLIICARSLQLGFGLYGTYRLRRVHVFAVKNHWPDRVLQLADALGVKQTITLLESGLAKVPMVIGNLKPVILVPIGLLTALSTEEVEAILIHELAHIRRRDYLVNMLQSLMEILFFFNPAVLWVSKLIKTERENCCDDLAVAQNNNKVNYIRALVSCEEYQSNLPAYAMAFPGGRNTLLDRVKRMANNRNHSLNMFEKTVLAVCLVAVGLGVSAFTAREDIKKAVNKVVAAIVHKTKAEDKMKLNKVDTTKKQPAASIESARDTFMNQQAANAAQLLRTIQQYHLDTLKNTGDQLAAVVHQMDSLKRLGDPRAVLAALQQPDTSRLKKLMGTLQPRFKVFHDVGMELYREGLVTDTSHMNITLNERELIVNGVRLPKDVHTRIYRKYGKEFGNGNYSSDYDNNGSYGSNYANNYVPQVVSEPPTIVIPDFGDTLIKYGFIKDKRHIRATFNNRELVINGIKQPDDVHQMLLKKYGGDANITYTNNGLPDARMDQNTYWAGQQRKIIDQMQREGLINDRRNLTFLLTDKQFRINGVPQNDDVFQRYHQEYVPASAGDNWVWNYNGPSASYLANANRYGNSGMYYQQNARERQRIEAERDKKLVADLLQDGLITDPNDVTFTLSNKKLEINGKKQSAEIYQKYKEKYVPNDSGGEWSWTYSHHK